MTKTWKKMNKIVCPIKLKIIKPLSRVVRKKGEKIQVNIRSKKIIQKYGCQSQKLNITIAEKTRNYHTYFQNYYCEIKNIMSNVLKIF